MQGVQAVTWGVFPGREVLQPTVIDPDAFMVWKARGVCCPLMLLTACPHASNFSRVFCVVDLVPGPREIAAAACARVCFRKSALHFGQSTGPKSTTRRPRQATSFTKCTTPSFLSLSWTTTLWAATYSECSTPPWTAWRPRRSEAESPSALASAMGSSSSVVCVEDSGSFIQRKRHTSPGVVLDAKAMRTHSTSKKLEIHRQRSRSVSRECGLPRVVAFPQQLLVVFSRLCFVFVVAVRRRDNKQLRDTPPPRQTDNRQT